MLIIPLPGHDRENLRSILTGLHQQLVNLRGGGGGQRALARVISYIDWAQEARRMLRNQVRPAEAQHLVPTKSWELALTATTTFASIDPAGERLLNGFVSAELDERIHVLKRALADLTDEMERFTRPGALIILDTTCFIEHRDKLEDLDHAAAMCAGTDDIHIIVPMVVIDELDGLKRVHDKKWRASYTLAYLDKLLPSPDQIGVIRPSGLHQLMAGGELRGSVTVQILFDPPGHVRAPIADDEIIDRAVAVQSLAGRRVWLATIDTGMAFRGRAAGLNVLKMEKPDDDEEQPRSSGKRRGKAGNGSGAAAEVHKIQNPAERIIRAGEAIAASKQDEAELKRIRRAALEELATDLTYAEIAARTKLNEQQVGQLLGTLKPTP
ncbi:PIN domain-containing protein [Micromonospora humida]|uniref:PIN domain-containing protein n=1 Tax=Micromonospora humida TaxID=2809018 RepID=UPI0033F727D5